MPINYDVTDDGNCIAITDTTTSTKIETIPKEKVVLQIVPAGESQNKSGVDELWIQHDGKYSTEIPYLEGDVSSSGVAPASAEAFRVAVLALLNLNTSALPFDLAVIRLTQTGTAAPVQNELFNPAGISFGYARTSLGTYKITPSGTWTADKSIIINCGNFEELSVGNFEHINCFFSTPLGAFIIETADLASGQTDDLLSNSTFIIIKLH